jgi:hypothetical protein
MQQVVECDLFYETTRLLKRDLGVSSPSNKIMHTCNVHGSFKRGKRKPKIVRNL